MSAIQDAKRIALSYQAALDSAATEEIEHVLGEYLTDDCLWRGMHPFYEQNGASAIANNFWKPLRTAFSPLQRRNDVFIAGNNDADEHGNDENDTSTADATWVCSMGHFFGLFDKPFLDIPATGKMVFIRYAEFLCVSNNKIIDSAFFFDLIGIMQQAGQYPLPPQTGAFFMHPGPRTHDGLLYEEQSTESGVETMALVNRMVEDLSQLNISGEDNCPPELLAKCWADDMIWYGPTGIGSTYTITRYQKQHQYPFREGLKDKVFNGHVARFAEGTYACFFGWANLTNSAKGGFLGLTGNETRADMRVVDVYRREGDKLAENWVFIDLPHYLSMQGLDVLDRMRRTLLPANN